MAPPKHIRLEYMEYIPLSRRGGRGAGGGGRRVLSTLAGAICPNGNSLAVLAAEQIACHLFEVAG